MFRDIIDRLREAGEYIIRSRLVTLIVIFILTSSILVGRLFICRLSEERIILKTMSCRSERQGILLQPAAIFMTVTGICWHTMSWHIPLQLKIQYPRTPAPEKRIKF